MKKQKLHAKFSQELWLKTLIYTIVFQGRRGKGNIFVFASGNDGFFYDSCTYDGYVTSIHTIAVSAVNLDGSFSSKMEKCPSIMAVTYARDPGLGFDSTAMPMVLPRYVLLSLQVSYDIAITSFTAFLFFCGFNILFVFL